ncbi:hypothetical protein SK128_013963 [Halocaridina rubra]|uniref:Uncharacterized protein n=1 Tax=Halocaridina rubra TaxID=373956 RepID=A0AAN8X525_HALRR
MLCIITSVLSEIITELNPLLYEYDEEDELLTPDKGFRSIPEIMGHVLPVLNVQQIDVHVPRVDRRVASFASARPQQMAWEDPPISIFLEIFMPDRSLLSSEDSPISIFLEMSMPDRSLLSSEDSPTSTFLEMFMSDRSLLSSEESPTSTFLEMFMSDRSLLSSEDSPTSTFLEIFMPDRSLRSSEGGTFNNN